MRVLFTGASSFTGYWFVKELTQAGHEVIAVIRRRPDEYEGVRRERVQHVTEIASFVRVCSFGDDEFLACASEGWDLLCHHASETAEYKSPDFDVTHAFAANTRRLPAVLDALRAGGGGALVLTGTVFESDEGYAEGTARAFSPYGLSKSLTFQAFRFYCEAAGVRFGKFVIPNPFGPFEEPRFTSHLVRSWYEGMTPTVSTPDYIRDNIHVSLLARAYVRFAESVPVTDHFVRVNPSGYRESQGDFARRFAREMERRLPVPCPVEFGQQADVSEPLVRTNTDQLDMVELGWDEEHAWDDLAAYYARTFDRAARM